MSLRAVPALAALALTLTACASTTAEHGTGQAVSTFTCCAGHDVDRAYRPGDLVTIHWIRETSEAVAPSAAIPITLTAHLDGAFAGVAQAKSPAGHGNDQITASPVQVNGP